MRFARGSIPFSLLLLVVGSCGAPSPSGDAAADARASDAQSDAAGDTDMCRNDNDCSDTVFCDGVERCMPGAAGANVRGCVPASPAFPCTATQLCDEANRRCVTQCSMEPDADGDGHRSRGCGGDDCDDADPNRFPGNAEVCDPMHDEDCDPTTIGVQDSDNDLQTSALCCNSTAGSVATCGTDCNDADATVNTRAPEVCDAVDNNCNGQIDEGVLRAFFPDTDHDNFGDSHAANPTRACAPSAGLVENALDCDDTNAAVSPVASEVCDGRDNNCNGAVDEDPSATFYCASSYGTPANTTFGCTTDAAAMTGTCVVQSCRTGFGNCNTQIEDGCETNLQSSPIHCGACPTVCGAGGVCSSGACDPFTHVAVGVDYVCASRASGSVVCWGGNGFGQLGDGTTNAAANPVVTGRFTGANMIAAGRFDLTSPSIPIETGCPTTCVQSGSSLSCWGCNESAQTGVGFASGAVLSPSAVRDFPAVDPNGAVLQTVSPQISVGAGHACGWQMNQNAFPVLYCWGRNNAGQSNPRNTATVLTPTALPIVFNHDSLSIAAGGRHTCVATTTVFRGVMRCWGANDFGQRGPGAVDANGIAIVQGPASEMPSDWAEVVAGDLFTCGRFQTSHHVACWGFNAFGQLGDGTTNPHTMPTIVPGISTAAQLAASTHSVCMRNTAGQVRCWGEGYGNSPVTIAGISDATEIAMGGDRACALRATGTIVCWTSGTAPMPLRPAGTGNF